MWQVELRHPLIGLGMEKPPQLVTDLLRFDNLAEALGETFAVPP